MLDEFGERMLPRSQRLERTNCGDDFHQKVCGRLEGAFGQAAARLRRMQIGTFAAAQFGKLFAEGIERLPESIACRTWTRSPQNRSLEGRNRVIVSAGARAEPRERMLEETEQARG